MSWRGRALVMLAVVSLAAGRVPPTSYIDFKFGDEQEETTTTPTEAPVVADSDRSRLPGTSYIDRDKDTSASHPSAMEREKTTTPPTEAPGAADEIDIDRTGVPGTSYIDRDKNAEPDSNTTESDKTTTTVTPPGPPVKEPGTTEKPDVDHAGVPGTSYIDRDKNTVNLDSNTTESDKTTTAVTPPGPPVKEPGTIEKTDVDHAGVPGTSYIDGENNTVNLDSNTTESDKTTTAVTPPGPPVKEPGTIEKTDVDHAGVPGTSYIDGENNTVTLDLSSNTTDSKNTTTTITPTGPPVKVPGTTEKPDVDLTGVPGTSYINREKDTVNVDSSTKDSDGTSKTMTTIDFPVKAPGMTESTDVDYIGVPGTSYIDREKETVNPDSNTTADFFSPMIANHIGHADANNQGNVNKNPSEFVRKAGESHSNKEKLRSGESKKKATRGKLDEIRKEVNGVQGERIKLTKSKRSVTETNKRKTKKSNHNLLNHLGLRKLKMPAVNHHRKRLASQSRKAHLQTSSADSKMFVIKLPPEPYYYAHHDLIEGNKNPVNTLPVSFSSNGKPSRVYHWNIPAMKKMVARKAGSPKLAVFADSDVFNIDKQATWNESGDEKPYHTKTAFYAPKKASKEAFRKYFSGNGKPHSFYVMSKSKTPISTYRLLP